MSNGLCDMYSNKNILLAIVRKDHVYEVITDSTI